MFDYLSVARWETIGIFGGGTFFFTVVTHKRKPLFACEKNINALRPAFSRIESKQPFHIEAIVILPDHLHCIWRLPEEDHDYSGIWREIKKLSSRLISPHCNNRKERTVWQRRFWEQLIRDEQDLHRHMDYIHYNPVKHG